MGRTQLTRCNVTSLSVHINDSSTPVSTFDQAHVVNGSSPLGHVNPPSVDMDQALMKK